MDFVHFTENSISSNPVSNQSRVTEFLLHGFPDTKELQTFHFISFLIIYLVALMENLLIIAVIMNTHLLHKPMHFDQPGFPRSWIHLCYNSQINDQCFYEHNSISYGGCVCQVFFLIVFIASHFFLLGVMAYDRYVAICNPLQNEMVMNRKTSIKMAAGTRSAGLLYSTVYTGSTFTIEFCSNEIHQFFCEVPQLFKIPCSDQYVIAFFIISGGAFLAFIYYILIIYSYVEIFRAVLRILSNQGKQKAFSTCLPHLIVIILYVLTSSFAYLKPISKFSSTMNLLISMFYCMLTLVMNPLIYSMRNKEVKMTFRKLIGKLSSKFIWRDHLSVQHFSK